MSDSSPPEGLVQSRFTVKVIPTGAITRLSLSEEERMSTSPEPHLTRAERAQLTAAVVRGVVSGAARALVSWLLEEHIHP
jgi:hypothetical protein